MGGLFVWLLSLELNHVSLLPNLPALWTYSQLVLILQDWKENDVSTPPLLRLCLLARAQGSILGMFCSDSSIDNYYRVIGSIIALITIGWSTFEPGSCQSTSSSALPLHVDDRYSELEKMELPMFCYVRI